MLEVKVSLLQHTACVVMTRMHMLTYLFWMTVLSVIRSAALANCITLPRVAGMSMNGNYGMLRVGVLAAKIMWKFQGFYHP